MQKLQQTADDAVRLGLEAIRTAIESAYDVTRVQMQDGRYHEDVVQTAFAQFLVHNVRDGVAKIKALGLVSLLTSNSKGTAHHEAVYIEDKLLITISAVRGPSALPRPAQFRNDYTGSLQIRFIPRGDEFLIVMPPGAKTQYVQILHSGKRLQGPLRQHLGFIQVAFPDSAGGYRRGMISLDDYIAEWSRPGARAETEHVEDNLGIKLKEGPRASKQ